MIKGVDHIGIAVLNIEEFLSNFCSIFSLDIPQVNVITERHIKVALLRLRNVKIEIIEDLSSDGLIAKSLKERGPGIHHICLESDDIVNDVEFYLMKGIPLIDTKPKIGVRGKRIAFLSPDVFDGIFIEISEP